EKVHDNRSGLRAQMRESHVVVSGEPAVGSVDLRVEHLDGLLAVANTRFPGAVLGTHPVVQRRFEGLQLGFTRLLLIAEQCAVNRFQLRTSDGEHSPIGQGHPLGVRHHRSRASTTAVNSTISCTNVLTLAWVCKYQPTPRHMQSRSSENLWRR